MIHLQSRIAALIARYIGVLAVIGITGVFSPAEAANEIVINSGAPVTNYHQVSLAISNPPVGTATMSFRNDSGSWSNDEPVAASKPWTLSAPDGVKKVSVLFKNGSGTTLGIYSSTIKLDYIIDTAFSAPDGKTEYANPGFIKATAHAVAVQPADQRVVVVGTSDDDGDGNTELRIIRYMPDGTYDTSFGGGTGMAWYGNSNNPTAPVANTTGSFSGNAVAIQPDGKIVVVGTYQLPNGKSALWLLRLSSNGSLDPLFNPALGGGFLVMGGIGNNTTGNAVAIQPDGKIVVVGTYDNGGTNNTAPWVLRFNTDGSLDTLGFNFTGEVVLNAAPGAHTGRGLALQSDGKIVVVGTYDHNDGLGNTSVWAIRLTSAGQLDTTFGHATVGNPLVKLGYDTFGFNGSHTGNAVAINPSSGKISVVGTWDWTGGDTDLWLLQLNSDGSLDPTFNPNKTGIPPGSVALGGSGADKGGAVTVQADGKIIVVGTYDNGFAGTSLLVERINADSSYDTTFNRGNEAYSFGTQGVYAGNGIAIQSDNKIVVAGTGYRKETNGANTSSLLTMRLHYRTWPLTVTTVGSGTVGVLPGDFTWTGATGSGTYLPGTVVQLTAIPAPGGATFTGWSGACTGTGACSVTMDAVKNVTATFSLPFDLTVKITGAGTGTVSTNQNGFSCASSSCTASLPPNTSVSLTAVPAWYSLFGSWTGCDSVTTNVCTVALSNSRTVTASFNQNMTVKLPLGNKYYFTLHDGYIAADASGQAPPVILQAQAFTFFENLQFNLPVTVTLQGGKDAAFSATPVGVTTVSGSLKVSAGRLNATSLSIKP